MLLLALLLVLPLHPLGELLSKLSGNHSRSVAHHHLQDRRRCRSEKKSPSVLVQRLNKSSEVHNKRRGILQVQGSICKGNRARRGRTTSTTFSGGSSSRLLVLAQVLINLIPGSAATLYLKGTLALLYPQVFTAQGEPWRLEVELWRTF